MDSFIYSWSKVRLWHWSLRHSVHRCVAVRLAFVHLFAVICVLAGVVQASPPCGSESDSAAVTDKQALVFSTGTSSLRTPHYLVHHSTVMLCHESTSMSLSCLILYMIFMLLRFVDAFTIHCLYVVCSAVTISPEAARSDDDDDDDDDDDVHLWLIAVIVVAAILFILLLIIAAIVVRRKRHSGSSDTSSIEVRTDDVTALQSPSTQIVGYAGPYAPNFHDIEVKFR